MRNFLKGNCKLDKFSLYYLFSYFILLHHQSEESKDQNKIIDHMRKFVQKYGEGISLDLKINYDKVFVLVGKAKDLSFEEILRRLTGVIQSNVIYKSSVFNGAFEGKPVFMFVKNSNVCLYGDDFEPVYKIQLKNIKTMKIKDNHMLIQFIHKEKLKNIIVRSKQSE